MREGRGRGRSGNCRCIIIVARIELGPVKLKLIHIVRGRHFIPIGVRIGKVDSPWIRIQYQEVEILATRVI